MAAFFESFLQLSHQPNSSTCSISAGFDQLMETLLEQSFSYVWPARPELPQVSCSDWKITLNAFTKEPIIFSHMETKKSNKHTIT